MKTNEYKEYCDNLAYELEGWKERLDRVVSQFDHVSTGDKEKVVPEINGLHILSDELADRMKGLCYACASNWEPPREDHEVVWPNQSEMRSASVSVSDIGG